jgi:predicted Rossmann-fold nucleotide-binding protein
LEIAAAADVRQITIISGGQTGADRAALDFAIEHGIPHGGWCPRGRIAEDGPIPLCYSLRETPSRRYAQRTEWNVRDSHATVVFTIGDRRYWAYDGFCGGVR